MRYDQYYRELNNVWVQAFGQPGAYRDVQREMKAAGEIRNIVGSLARDLDKVVGTIRQNYLEIDLDETSKQFEDEYRDMVKPAQVHL
ncbi:MAG: hypothetical protein EOQ46_26420 [Mesorhizobium sp.]|uniref:hypothetical protein n=1 Tax=Mesorhizobium sp. TaxID=1871066 RepID=UPI000FE96307|nr:hypothetical protein [Mesorhizobium sp.]RWB39769.1 MAG: hypothetical protein EOQ46_26420 [Mesorhizobium sp.]